MAKNPMATTPNVPQVKVRRAARTESSLRVVVDAPGATGSPPIAARFIFSTQEKQNAIGTRTIRILFQSGGSLRFAFAPLFAQRKGTLDGGGEVK